MKFTKNQHSKPELEQYPPWLGESKGGLVVLFFGDQNPRNKSLLKGMVVNKPGKPSDVGTVQDDWIATMFVPINGKLEF